MIVLLILVVLVAGCSSSPTAPTPIAAVPAPVPTPTPTPVPTPTPNAFLSDPRFDRAFYRQFALNGFESPSNLAPLRRQSVAPLIYLYTVDDAGAPIDARTLDATAAAIETVAGALTGRFGVEGIERGTGPTNTVAHRVTVRWGAQPNGDICGRVDAVGGRLIMLYPKTPGCQCGAITMRPQTVKHEMGHILGYWHTNAPSDLMYISAPAGTCDKQPSARELFHAQVAYSMPIGSLEP